ncbi:hypothetical protein [Nannocystis pusilla]|uniref:hypothetical protein n=1 Tax=Nannocystis pusilla TaxID=889268 RepID=UPI003B79257C
MWVAVSVCLACGGGGGDGDTADADADSDTGVPSGGGEVCEGEVHTGEATYYAADGSGNCSFDLNPGDPMVAAMNIVDYAASAVCGACVAIDGPDGSIIVRMWTVVRDVRRATSI